MKKKLKPKTLELTYNERSAKMTNVERKACAKIAGQKFIAAQVAADKIVQLKIQILNNFREAGEQFIIACGREQLTFNLEGREFCRKHLIPHLPDGMTVDNIQACCHIAAKIPEPIKTKEQLRSVEREIQLSFQSLGLADAPNPRQLQVAHERNLFTDLVNRFGDFGARITKLDSEQPMEKWPVAQLDDFIHSAKDLKVQIVRAEKIRQLIQ